MITLSIVNKNGENNLSNNVSTDNKKINIDLLLGEVEKQEIWSSKRRILTRASPVIVWKGASHIIIPDNWNNW